MTLSDLRTYSITLMVPLCFASGAAAMTDHRMVAYAINLLMAVVFVDHVAGGVVDNWRLRSSVMLTTALVGAGLVGSYGVLPYVL